MPVPYHRIRYGFTPNGDFIAVDRVTQAASCGYRTSIYASKAHKDAEATAREMIRDELRNRQAISYDIWKEHFNHLDIRIGSTENTLTLYEDA